jgi:hypothetical protein
MVERLAEPQTGATTLSKTNGPSVREDLMTYSCVLAMTDHTHSFKVTVRRRARGRCPRALSTFPAAALRSAKRRVNGDRPSNRPGAERG